MKSKIINKEKLNLREYHAGNRMLLKEERAALKKEIPMTQELFESSLGHMLRGEGCEMAVKLLEEYPEYRISYEKKTEEEIEHISISEEQEKQSLSILEQIFAELV